jgi:hypothetical protein
VQLIDLALAVEVLEAPHPPLARGVDLERLVGRTHDLEKTTVAQTKIAIATKNESATSRSRAGSIR